MSRPAKIVLKYMRIIKRPYLFWGVVVEMGCEQGRGTHEMSILLMLSLSRGE